jgi:hypothetical protein
MTPDELLALYRDFTDEAIRVEAQQHYVVPGDEDRQRAFREGRPLPERPAKAATLRLIASSVAAGKAIGRVHIVDRPLSDYVRYELAAAYPENVAAGEEVWITDRAVHPALDAVRRDFVLFDARTDHPAVVWYDYTPDGRLIGYRRGGDDDIATCLATLDLARSHAVPLAAFPSPGGRDSPPAQ